MLSTIFLAAGLNHLMMTAQVASRLESAPLGYLATWMAPAETLVLLAGFALLLGGIGLLVGWKTRWSALLLIAVIVPITLTIQVGSLSSTGPLFKNVGLTGGLLYFLAHGADAFSVDRWLANRGASADMAYTEGR